ncbi:ATP synthase subunit H protein (Va0H) (atp6H) (Atp6v0e) [Ranunculus cassubicifolius]
MLSVGQQPTKVPEAAFVVFVLHYSYWKEPPSFSMEGIIDIYDMMYRARPITPVTPPMTPPRPPIIEIDEWWEYFRENGQAITPQNLTQLRENLRQPNAEVANTLHGHLENRATIEAMAEVGDRVVPNSPLEQFEILPLIPMNIGDLYFSFTNSSLFMLLTLSFFLLLVHFVTKNGGGKSVPNAWQSLVELIYDFVLNLVQENPGISGSGKSGTVCEKSVEGTLSGGSPNLSRNTERRFPRSFRELRSMERFFSTA